jgi:hypothetical protein
MLSARTQVRNSAWNPRLTAEQLAALAPGDVVAIESGLEFGRRRIATATVARVDGVCITVKCTGPRGSTFVERYSLRTGLRVGGGTRAELVHPQSSEPAEAAQLDGLRTVDRLYREWRRQPGDEQLLRRLHEAIGELMPVRAKRLSLVRELSDRSRRLSPRP